MKNRFSFWKENIFSKVNWKIISTKEIKNTINGKEGIKKIGSVKCVKNTKGIGENVFQMLGWNCDVKWTGDIGNSKEERLSESFEDCLGRIIKVKQTVIKRNENILTRIRQNETDCNNREKKASWRGLIVSRQCNNSVFYYTNQD